MGFTLKIEWSAAQKSALINECSFSFFHSHSALGLAECMSIGIVLLPNMSGWFDWVERIPVRVLNDGIRQLYQGFVSSSPIERIEVEIAHIHPSRRGVRKVRLSSEGALQGL
jgi:hypothetical protein